MARARQAEFDPIGILQALDRQRATYIVVGALARVIQGADEVTDGIDIVPSMRPENLRRIETALEELHARRSDGKRPALKEGVFAEAVLELQTDRGEMKIIPEPAGTRGYDGNPGCD